MTLPDASGHTYMWQRDFDQLFNISSTGQVQYCSSEAQATFQLHSSTDTELIMCWRGPRLASHKAGCTGCDCARWNITFGATHDAGDDIVPWHQLQSTFYQSPPVVHAEYLLKKTGDAIAPESSTMLAQKFGQCAITETDKPNEIAGARRNRPHPSSEQRKMGGVCPFRKQLPTPPLKATTLPSQMPSAASSNLSSTSDSGHKFCTILNRDVDTRLAYTVPTLPCKPCNVRFTFSMPSRISWLEPWQQTDYISIGFKERSDAWAAEAAGFGRPGDNLPNPPGEADISNYWGMSTSKSGNTSLSGRILAMHGEGNITHLKATAYVGVVEEVEDDGFFTDLSAETVDGKKTLSFTANLDMGETEDDASWQGKHFGAQRVMWASGLMNKGKVDWHWVKGLCSLNYPGAGSQC